MSTVAPASPPTPCRRRRPELRWTRWCAASLLASSTPAFVSGGISYADWQAQVWRPTEVARTAISGRMADPDGDRLVNFAEYALGADPRCADREAVLRWSTTATPEPGTLDVQYRRSTAAVEAEVRVAAATQLPFDGDWPAGRPAEVSEFTRDAGAGRTETRVSLPASAGAAFIALPISAAIPAPEQPAWVWFEAEAGSGGESDPDLSAERMTWVGPGGSVQKSVRVPAAGSYDLWVRKFWNPQGIRWRVGGADWQEVRTAALTDLVLLNGNAGRRVGWFNAGRVDLPAGDQVFRLEVLPGDGNTTAYDCFLLAREPFTPRGKLKPDEASGATEPGWFAFEPPPDPLTYSPIDLRRLNEEQAGEQGFIRVRGEGFIHDSSGEPVRFWAVNVGMGFVNSADAELDLFARSMAKRGVNLVRVHGPIYEGRGPDFGRVNEPTVARLQYLVHALKREGIYSALSIYFPLWVTLGPENTAFSGYTGQHPFALPYFSEPFQAFYRDWWRSLLVPVNPHTGLALKDDPAVAMVEMINEDSTLFWTFDPQEGSRGNLPDAQRARLERQFANWLLARYPGETLAQIRSGPWQGLATSQDDLVAGRMGFRPLWNIFSERRPRDQDTARFLTGLMREWHLAVRRFLKEELGCRALVYCSNWKTASEQYLDPLDKYANSVGDFFDRHGYFGGVHEGNNASWNLEPGQRYDDRTAVRFVPATGAGEDFGNPLFDLAYNGRPSTITEVNWPLPNRYRADMVVLGAAYGALQGSDAIFWFAAGEPTWQGLPGKFAIQTPVGLGQFPAAALIFREGLVRTASRVVDVQLAVEDLYALKGTPLPAPQNFDNLRSGDVPAGAVLTNVSVIDSLAFLVGRVNVDFVERGPVESRVRDLSPYIDRQGKRALSETGELRWDWGRGLVTVNAPAAQGATGFLRDAGAIRLETVEIASSMEYGSILIVALDGRPLAEAERVLLQAASEERPWQWSTDRPAGPRRITNRGTVPLMVRELAGTVRLQRPDAGALTVTPLDANGYRSGPPATGAAVIELAADRLYYLIEK
ncbi:MAG: hypothetical protein H7A45_01225 [Verrucomicrobiales bacterium]|nr:hypothetical protein [Verrucomicrobiales bacterium]